MASSRATPNTNTSTKGNSTTRRRKIEIKRVEQTNKRHVTFSKRKLGLFNKVTELSILCQAETALIVTSQNGKLYACGYPAPDTVIRRFLAGGSPQKSARALKKKQKECVETLRVQYEATQEILKEEKKCLEELKETNKACLGFPSWWEYPIDEMGLEELEKFKGSLEQLKVNLVATAEQKVFNSLQQMPLSSMAPMQRFSNFPSILNGGLCTTQQAWDWRNNGIASSSNSSLGSWDWRNNGIGSSDNSSLLPNVDFGYY